MHKKRVIVAIFTASLVLVGVEMFWGRPHLEVYPHQVDIAFDAEQEQETTELTVVNRTNQDLKILGGSASCQCMVVRGLPTSVPARSTKVVEVDVYPGKEREFKRRVVLFTDNSEFPLLTTRISGENKYADSLASQTSSR